MLIFYGHLNTGCYTSCVWGEKTTCGERVQPRPSRPFACPCRASINNSSAVTSSETSAYEQLLHNRFSCACSCTLRSWRQRWRWCLFSQLCWSFRPRPTCASCSRTSEAARSTSTHPVSRLTDVYVQVPTLYLHVPLSQVQVTVFSSTKNAAGVQQRNLVSSCSKKCDFFLMCVSSVSVVYSACVDPPSWAETTSLWLKQL